MPEGHACSVQGQKCSGNECGRQAFALPGRLPVHVCEPQPHCKFIQGQCERNTKQDSYPQMPFWIACGECSEPYKHEQEDAPEKMMNMQSAFRDEIVDRQELIGNNIRKCAEER